MRLLFCALALILSNGAMAASPTDLGCELVIQPVDGSRGSTMMFAVELGTPKQGGIDGYDFYITYQKTTKVVVTYQVAHDDGFFVHGSSTQPENDVSFTALGSDGVRKNNVYLACKSGSKLISASAGAR